MRTKLVAVALAVLVVLSGCSAIDINRPADNASNTTEAPGGAGAPAEGTDDAETGDADETVTEQAADPATRTATADAGTTEPTATPASNVLRLSNGDDEDYVVAVTVTKGPIEAVKLHNGDDSTDIVVLDGRSVDDVLTADTVDVEPIEVVQASQEFAVDSGETVTETLPGGERRHVLVELLTDDEAATVVGAGVVTCTAGDTIGEVSVIVDGDDVEVTRQCGD
ncbi:hypothetical protein ACFPYI_05485 [Halomarina salina]|uniref:DUF4382 domain-containing protein n=1 Tax=Halomarina salina TaxID=1872699 RepID=A0ABD5RJJ6_9EURY|nr:hypothetical protein [Halomarina salina]